MQINGYERKTHNSVVSFGMPLGSERSPRLLQRTTVSEHVQESGQRGVDGRQTFSSTPERKRDLNFYSPLHHAKDKCVAKRTNIETHQFFKRKKWLKNHRCNVSAWLK